jgi:WD40 repeat protein
VRLWDAGTLHERAAFFHDNKVSGLTFSVDGTGLLTSHRAGPEGKVLHWELATGKRTLVVGSGPMARISADGKLGITNYPNVRLYDLATGKVLYRFEDKSALPYAVALSPDGRLAFHSAVDASILMINTATGVEEKRFPSPKAFSHLVRSLSCSGDGKRLLAGYHAGIVILWDNNSGMELSRFTFNRYVIAVALSADGRQGLAGTVLLTGTQPSRVSLLDLEKRVELRHFEVPDARSMQLAYSPDGKRAVTGDRHGVVQLWDLETCKELLPSQGLPGTATTVALFPDGSRAVAAGSLHGLRVWDVVSGRIAWGFDGDRHSAFTCVTVSPDGRYILSGDKGGAVRLWDAATGEKVRAFIGHDTPVNAVAFAPDGRLVYSAGGSEKSAAEDVLLKQGAIRIWDVETGKEVGWLTGHREAVFSLCVSPDGRRVVSGGGRVVPPFTGVVRLWDTDTHQTMQTLPVTFRVHCVALSTNGRHVLSGDIGNRLLLWDLEKPDKPRVLSPPYTVRSVAFLPEDREMVSVGADGHILVWNLSGEVVGLWRLPGAIHGLALASDGKHLATANSNGTVTIFRLPAPRPPKPR